MKATEANLLKFIRKSPQFVIPIYQRNYSWEKGQCVQLWNDLLRAGRSETVRAHFLGSIVYVERALSSVTNQEALLVIDGQQRLTTSILLIAALERHFDDEGLDEILDTFSARKLRNYYLVNPDESGDRHYKLLLSETDSATLLAIIRNTPLPQDCSLRISENFTQFRSLIATHAHEIEAVCEGLSKLTLVEVALDRAHDNPQLIFESMNSTGLELSQADLIRNYILMGLEPDLQKSMYVNYWRPMEIGFGQAAYTTYFDAFMRHYLTVKTGEIPNVRHVYTAFKNYAQAFDGVEALETLVADIHTFATYYWAMALDKEPEVELRGAFHDLRELKVDVAFPFLLDVYDHYKRNLLTTKEVVEIVRMVETHVFRRAICGLPTNALNKIFAGLSRSIDKSRYLESTKAAFILLPTYRRMPSDAEFERDLKQRDLYNFRTRGFWLRRFENHGRKERVLVDDYTIEHIMPQNEKLSPEWRSELGPDWQRVQQAWLHTLGNLTLSGYNSEYKDRPWLFKRDQVTNSSGEPIGLSHSPLRLNQGLETVGTWNEHAIKERADRLAKHCLRVWPMPSLTAEQMARYLPTYSKPAAKYSLADHYHLKNGAMGPLFEKLRIEILELDPNVVEDVMKVYVAYKAETNFVDVVPQSKQLRLSINMPFFEIDDPKGICIDVTNLGRWGNGDVEITMNSVEEIPYAMGLVRQAFERQMGFSSEA
ncbi:DUF262 and DUF1524 domain-containing protein [Aurantimonas sp. HBX-1]|uniref:DUF262 and DUF1524 domain-containing protein n=1 Tax=Aurantimonas sp. HBX-1 TaxID=2906072 RepID=UPI001F37F5D3|nr:DUF262 and DUF1524 domain-containing protein [Aurantimonas sp. HBX-1]UIJ71916.1 DUF262 and DUF1524 domain-containing protein [Aurantimonas sp. HBX-1]